MSEGQYTHIFLDADTLIESKNFDEWNTSMFGSAQLVIGWQTLKELDKQKNRAGYRGDRCRELLKILKGSESIVLCAKTGLTAIMPDRPIKVREFNVYPLDEAEADDWLIAEAEKFRQEDTNARKVAIFTGDGTVLVKIRRISSFKYLHGLELPREMLRGDARRERAKERSQEQLRLRAAAKDFVAAIEACMASFELGDECSQANSNSPG